jgi:hypothetical protein
VKIEPLIKLRVALACVPAVALLALAGLAPVASAAKPSPPASVHAIFDDGATAPFRVGQVVQVAAARKPSPGKIAKVCFSPAPISRPACGKAPEGAPSAVGVTKITVYFSRRKPYVLKVKILAAATKVGGDQGGLAVPATVTCPSLSLYPDAHEVATKSEKPLAILPEGTKVALYDTLAPNAIAMIDYATGTVGIGEESCATPGI